MRSIPDEAVRAVEASIGETIRAADEATKAARERANAAVRTIEMMGYEYRGGLLDAMELPA